MEAYMKRLVCEMCGSSDIIKKDGFYVCDTCGTKYSLEEAKKLFVEVSGGTITVSNNPQEKNLEKLATDAYESRNWKAAEDFANQVLAINDKNFEAWEIKAIAVCMQLSAFNTRMLEGMNCIAGAYHCKSGEEQADYREHLLKHLKNIAGSEIDARIKNYSKSGDGVELLNKTLQIFNKDFKRIMLALEFSEERIDEEFNLMTNKMIADGYNAIKTVWEMAAKKYYKGEYSTRGAKWEKTSIFGDVCWDEDERPDKIDFDFYLSAVDDNISLGENLIELVNPTTNEDLIFGILREMISENELAIKAVSFSTFWGGLNGDSKRWEIEYRVSDSSKAERNKQIQKWKSDIASVEKALKAEKERLQKEANEKYWSEHPDLKNELMEKIEVIKKEILSLEHKIKELEIKRNEIKSKPFVYDKQSEIDDLKKKKQDLEKQLAGISIFKVKERKEVKQNIENINYSLRKAEDRRSAAQRDFSFKTIEETSAIDKELDPLKRELERNKTELNKLSVELTKNR